MAKKDHKVKDGSLLEMECRTGAGTEWKRRETHCWEMEGRSSMSIGSTLVWLRFPFQDELWLLFSLA